MNRSPDLNRRRTIRDVATAAGVSISTASNALNDTGRINAETRERVRRIAKEIGFRPNAAARSLLGGRSHTVGIITNDTYGRLVLPMTAGVSEVLLEAGVSVFLCPTNNDPRLAHLHLEALLDKQVDGLIFTATRLDLEPPPALADLPIPIVHAFSEGPPERVSFVPDDAQGAELAVRHLLACGHRRIVHVTGEENYVVAHRRAQAYRALVSPEARVMFGEWTEEWGREAVEILFAGDGEKPGALFCGSDEIARGVIDALRDRRIRVPDDVAVIGFDNWEVVARQTRPPLSSIDMELKTIGRRAGEAVLALCRGETVPPGINRIACRLVPRDSCGRADHD
ncbi:LacI family DNA-binding transcriptional regulator [Antarcticirhabdus aurantiaca]|uniref:LacI family DNA-binding transcriptional regulator n=1 Tax=Antarcticirhabdus aurantiaca TaxID=2606717 RepID=A0ACD4NPQ1_9HYPH|nr:LacI family DNA-binding transcriptional regulator [Antarcticirhabdus aurantiaca]WAJ28808.1 LacI family DNA-binding transcriptional regulator [Jeongeuplla avenae]